MCFVPHDLVQQTPSEPARVHFVDMEHARVRNNTALGLAIYAPSAFRELLQSCTHITPPTNVYPINFVTVRA